MTKTFQPGFFSRLALAAKLVTRGGMAQVVEHFRRAGAASLKGGPSNPNEQIVAVFRCIQFLAESISSMPFCVSTDDDLIIDSGPIAELLDKPNPMMSGEAFWQQTIGWMLLSERGSAYWVFTRRIGGRPVEIVPVGDAQMRPITENRERGTGHVVAWEYRPAGHRWDQSERLELDEVWQVKVPGFDADRPWAGTPVLSVIRRAINQVYKSDIANEASLDNGVEPGGVLILDGTPTPEQENDIKGALHERQGAGNRRRHLVLKGNIRWEQIAASFTDMEFEKLKRYSRADICAGFGLDPSAVGFPPEGGRFEYAESAESKAWISRAIPMGSSLAGNFDRGVLVHYETDNSQRMYKALDRARPMSRAQRTFSKRSGRRARAVNGQRRLHAWFDASGVEAVKELYKSRVETASKMVKDLKATPEEAGDLMDLGLAGNAAQKLIWQSTSEMPFDPTPGSLPGDDDLPGPGPEDLEEEDDTETLEDRLTDRLVRLTESQKETMQRRWRMSWAGLEKAVAAKFSRTYIEARSETIANLHRVLGSEITELIMRRELIGEILFDIVAADNKLVARVEPFMRSAFQLGGDQSMQEAAVAGGKAPEDADPFNIKDPLIEDRMRARRIKIKETNRTLRRKLAEELADGIAAGEQLPQIEERIKKQFNFAHNRIKTITRTEVGGAVEDARQAGREQAKVPMKSWLSSRKETMRPWHMEMERISIAEPIANDEKFTLPETGASTPYPRGSGLTAKDAANCACTTIARYPDDPIKDARLMAHYLANGFITDRALLKELRGVA